MKKSESVETLMYMANPENRLSDEQEELILEAVLTGESLNQIAKTVGFTSIRSFDRYRAKYPEFDRELTHVRTAACLYLEDKMLEVADEYSDSKAARVKMEAIKNILGYRNPSVYAQRIDVTLSQTVSITAALQASTQCLIDLTRDVTPPAIEQASDIKDIIE